MMLVDCQWKSVKRKRDICQFILRSVMEKTGYWGAVRVVPRDTEGAEVLVSGTILESNGEDLELQITARDASGLPSGLSVVTGGC